MNHASRATLLQRSVAFCLATMITFSLLGGIDWLAQPQHAAQDWAAGAVNSPRG